MQEKKIIAGLYPRVSTEDQSRYGHSLDEQEDRLKKLCDYKEYEIYKIYREEGVSAKSMKRPKFQEMIEDMKSGKINKIIVYKLDRLTRSIQDLESIYIISHKAGSLNIPYDHEINIVKHSSGISELSMI